MWLVQGPQNIIEWGEIRGVGKSRTTFVNSLDLFSEGHGYCVKHGRDPESALSFRRL